MKKAILIFLTICLVSMFYFPFNFSFLPGGMNTKKMMGALGIGICVLKCLKQRKINAPKELVPVFLLAACVSVWCLFSIVVNHTNDTSYLNYITMMTVWLSAAYVAVVAIEDLHGRLDMILVGRYLVAVCVMQCVLALMIDNIPAFAAFVDRYIDQGQALLKEMNRLYGIGAALDVAGTRFSVALILIAALVRKEKSDASLSVLSLYLVAFVVISVVGSMIARTTYVGIILAVVYYCLDFHLTASVLERRRIKKIGMVLFVVGSFAVAGVVLYNRSLNFQNYMEFAFEGFFSLAETGEYSVASNETLMTMYVWPDNFETWMIGDGYFNNPRGDMYYVGDSTTQGYYMGTDVGYCRFIFYFGLIGLVVFSLFFIVTAVMCVRLIPEYRLMILMVLAANFVIWLKVATDVFPAFAVVLCAGLIMKGGGGEGPRVKPEDDGEVEPEDDGIEVEGDE